MDAKQYVERMFENVVKEHPEEFVNSDRLFVTEDVDITNKVALVNMIDHYEFMLDTKLKYAIIKTIKENNPTYSELKLIMQVVYNEYFNKNPLNSNKQHT